MGWSGDHWTHGKAKRIQYVPSWAKKKMRPLLTERPPLSKMQLEWEWCCSTPKKLTSYTGLSWSIWWHLQIKLMPPCTLLLSQIINEQLSSYQTFLSKVHLQSHLQLWSSFHFLREWERQRGLDNSSSLNLCAIFHDLTPTGSRVWTSRLLPFLNPPQTEHKLVRFFPPLAAASPSRRPNSEEH